MNDTQAKKHIYETRCAMAEKQQNTVVEKEKNAEEAMNTYRNAVIQAAIASEMLRRKKDQMVLLCYVGVIAVLALVGLIIGGPLLGITVIIAGFVIRYFIRSSKAMEIEEDIKGRTGFFYMYGVNFPHKWKGMSFLNSTPIEHENK